MYKRAFNSTAEAKLADDLRKAHDAVISLVAINQNKIVGHIMLSGIKAPTKALTLAPLAVHPDFQGQGIGSALILKALDLAKKDGWQTIFVLGGTGYFEHLGFKVTSAEGLPSGCGNKKLMALSLNSGCPSSTGEMS